MSTSGVDVGPQLAASQTHDRMSSADPVLTERVLGTFEDASSPRFVTIMSSLVSHLHAFASEVRLTEAEWAEAVDFVTRLGQISDDRRQETILLSDVLGLSMLVVGINRPTSDSVTESTVVGPFFVESSPAFSNGDDISGGASGAPCDYRGTVTDSDGKPLAGALMEIWHSDEDGNYDVQYGEAGLVQGRGHLRTDDEGRYWFTSVLPEPYPIPEDGPVGDLLAAARRSPMRPAHVHFMISSPGCSTLTTHVFRAGDRHLGADAVFGERDGLVRPFIRHDAAGPDGEWGGGARYSMTYDFVLARSTDLAHLPE